MADAVSTYWRTFGRTAGPGRGCFVADHCAAGGQDQFDIMQAEAEAVIQPDGVLDDLGGNWKS